MAIDFPTYEEIIDRIRADIAANLPDVDPTIFGSFLRAFADSMGGRSFDIIKLVEQLNDQWFPQTSTGEFLELWASYESLTRNVATGADGLITVTGTLGSTVPVSTQLTSLDGKIYTTDVEITLGSQVITASSLTRSGTTATFVASSDHNAASGMTLTIAGANETEYNGSFEIIVTDSDTFTYTVSGSPSTPATGTITATFTGNSVNVTSQDTGLETNLDSGAQLNLVTPIAGVDNSAGVQFTEVSGGADEETDSSLLERVLSSRSNPVANFNESAIELKAKEVSGVTRVKVKRITPDIGDVTILFVRDDDDNIIPSAGEVQDVKDSIVTILPATSDETNVIVTAPTPVTTNYTFGAIDPNTATMKAAIQTSLQAFYEDEVTFETDITEDKYRAAITNTIDPDTGDSLTSFSLTTPTADITVTTDEIGILGTVTFS
jgi:uncharacterized phage protein gp47/JayE